MAANNPTHNPPQDTIDYSDTEPDLPDNTPGLETRPSSPAIRHPRDTDNVLEQSHDEKKSRLLDSFDDIITLAVGTGHDQVEYIVHRSVLCDSSAYFLSACSEDWLKADKITTLPDEDPLIVRAMLYWMYHDKICIPKSIWDRRDDLDVSRALKTPEGFFVQLWVLADKLQVPALRRDAVDAWINYQYDYETRPNSDIIPYVYENTKDMECPLRKLVVLTFFWKSSDEEIPDLSNEFNCERLNAQLESGTSWRESVADVLRHGTKSEYEIIVPGPAASWCPSYHGHNTFRHVCCKFPKDYEIEGVIKGRKDSDEAEGEVKYVTWES